MKQKLFLLFIIFLLVLTAIPVFSEESFEDFQPVVTGMSLNFNIIVEHMEQKSQPWQVKVVKNSFPESMTITWVKTDNTGASSTGTRILTDLKLSRNFNPWFKRDETKDTADTAPWISVQILKELQETGKATNYREGGTGALNWATTDLVLKEKVIYPLVINGQTVVVHAFRLNKGLLIWNNLKNPLVLQYEPLGIPLFTSVSGWKLKSIAY